MLEATGVQEFREPFADAKWKAQHARVAWDWVGRSFQEHASRLKINYQIAPRPGSDRPWLWAVPNLMMGPPIAMGLGDAIHSLSCTLDYLIYELFEIYGGDEKAARMPVEQERSNVEKFLRTKAVQLPETVKSWVLDEVRPYRNGGRTDIWALRQLDNIDKHRLITPYVAAATIPDVNIAAGTAVWFDGSAMVVAAGGPTPIWPVKADDELLVMYQASIETVSYEFDESGVFDQTVPIGAFLVRTGQQMAKLIDRLTTIVYGDRDKFIDVHRGWANVEIPRPPRHEPGLAVRAGGPINRG